MPAQPYNLAIETSSRRGGVALGRGDELLATAELVQLQRHNVELLQAVDAMCQRHGARPDQIGQVYVSIGPGSFTGLRIGVTTAKMLGISIGCRLVAVPTLDVVVRNAPADRLHVAVCLNAKRGQCFTGIYERRGDDWTALLAPTLLTPAQLCDQAPRPLAVIGDHLPDHDWPDDVTLLDPPLAVPRSEMVWQLGRALAAGGEYVDALALEPLYVRLPEAEEKWRQRNGV